MLKGNLAPRGCVMKPAAADKRFLKHRGKAIAFEDYNHMMREIERDDLDVTPDHVLVLKNAGPKGGPGMPEWGMLPIPKQLVRAGVRDMVRISDGRMSGTSYGACILHVAPESFVGGPLAFVQTGDEIESRCRRAPHPSSRSVRRGAGPPPRRLEGAAAALSARLRRDVLRAYRPGRRGLRLRFSPGHGRDAGAGDSLKWRISLHRHSGARRRPEPESIIHSDQVIGSGAAIRIAAEFVTGSRLARIRWQRPE